MRKRLVTSALLVLAIALCACIWVMRVAWANAEAMPAYQTLDELEGKSFAYVNGSVYDKYIQEKIPNTSESFFPTLTDAVTAVESGKVDAAVQRSYACQLAVNRRNGTVALLPQTVKDMQECYFFPKGSELRQSFDEQVKRFWEDGTIDELTKKWASADDSIKTLPEQDWDAPNGTLRFVTTGQLEPFSYLGIGDSATGYDVDLALLICKELGYKLDIQMIGMDGIVAGVQSGKADFGGTLTYTDERAKAVDFSESVMPVYVSIIVKAKPTEGDTAATSAGDGTDGGLLSGMFESFNKTFITENRWQLILSGLGVTILISVCSGVLGVLLAFLTVVVRNSGKSWAGTFVNGYHAILGGMPIAVVLMLLYYVVFGAIDVGGEVVSIIAFTLSFGATAGATMWTGVQSIDAVQTESGLILGYTRPEVFRKIVFPQAALRFLPQLSSQLVSLVKETSVVGFIAVQDLTRAGDLIRSRTMEAFFPLVAIALIYFALCRLLAWGLGKFVNRYMVQNRPRVIKGVKL